MIKAKGMRTNCVTGLVTTIPITLEIKPEDKYGDRWVFIISGGPTGFESFMIADNMRTRMRGGWCAYGGAKGRWDKLRVSPDEMSNIFDQIEKELKDGS